MNILSRNSIYKRYFFEAKFIYFMIKDKTFFDKYMKIWEKVTNIIMNKFNIELIDNKKIPKFEKNSTQISLFLSMFLQTSNID